MKKPYVKPIVYCKKEAVGLIPAVAVGLIVAAGVGAVAGGVGALVARAGTALAKKVGQDSFDQRERLPALDIVEVYA
jgi:hypothetical protein